MSIPNEALQKLLQEIEAKATLSSHQLTLVTTQQTAKTRESRLLSLTLTELASLPPHTPLYEGVGKMFVRTDMDKVKGRIERDREELGREVEGLGKKREYLEMTVRNSREHLEQLFRRGAGA